MTCRCSVLLVSALLTGCGGREDRAPFASEAVYDTLADVGGADETNPLLIYRVPVGPQLVDDHSVVFSDNDGGRIVVVNLLTGEGWQVDDGGRDGPGEFGGVVPWLSETNGVIDVVTQGGQGSRRSLTGELLATHRFAEFLFDHEGVHFPEGILESGVLVVHFHERPYGSAEKALELDQEIQAYSPSSGVIWTYDDLPPIISQAERQPNNSVNYTPVSGDGVICDARHRTVVIAKNRETWVRVLNPDGSERARAKMPFGVVSVFIDADERIWVRVMAENAKSTGSYIVLDRDLNSITQVAERNIRDAKGDHLLTIGRDDQDLLHMYLLKREG